MADDQARVISRRELLRGAAIAGAAAIPGHTGLAVSTAGTGGLAPAVAGDPTAQTQALRPEAYETLTATEADILEAMVGRLIPNDEYGPGAIEGRAVHFIDRALGGALAGSREAYRAGLEAFDRYCRMSRGKPFVELSEIDQDSVLIDVETGAATGSGAGFTGSSAAFFNLVKGHTWQGMFGDPYYGGNANFVGWDLIGYPGVRTTVTAADQQRMERGELQPNHRSAYDNEMFNKATARLGTQGGAHHGD
jgi:gluconate 2-dehydrogenase gamma chain